MNGWNYRVRMNVIRTRKAKCLLQMTFEKDFTVDITTEYLTPFMSAYSKALQCMIDEGRLSVSGAIQSSFGGQVFGR